MLCLVPAGDELDFGLQDRVPEPLVMENTGDLGLILKKRRVQQTCNPRDGDFQLVFTPNCTQISCRLGCTVQCQAVVFPHQKHTVPGHGCTLNSALGFHSLHIPPPQFTQLLCFSTPAVPQSSSIIYRAPSSTN